MAARDFLGRLGERASRHRNGQTAAARDAAPLGGTRSEAMQRLQVGLTGLGAMILVISVASVLGDQADIAEEAAVPDAAPTTEPTAAPPQRDPLADAGVVPDIPPQPEAEPVEGAAEPVISDDDGALTVPDTLPTEPQGGGNDR